MPAGRGLGLPVPVQPFVDGGDHPVGVEGLLQEGAHARDLGRRIGEHVAVLDAEHRHIRPLRQQTAGVRQMLLEQTGHGGIVDGGRRLAASYANFLIVNGAVLMPAYGDRADAAAATVLENAFPGREIVQVPCRPLIWQNGSLHCITMQLPTGVV